jgi:hypothetical protein
MSAVQQSKRHFLQLSRKNGAQGVLVPVVSGLGFGDLIATNEQVHGCDDRLLVNVKSDVVQIISA